jgi:proteasome lid subunit RPN8/RPN11
VTRQVLSIRAAVVDQLRQHCLNQLPNEACGILAGQDQEITHFFPIPNLDQSPCSFQFEPRTYLDTIREMRKQELDWIGVVHSHPNMEPVPSAKDLANWHYPEKSYWILSLKGEQSRLSAYYIQKEKVVPVMYQIIVDR